MIPTLQFPPSDEGLRNETFALLCVWMDFCPQNPIQLILHNALRSSVKCPGPGRRSREAGARTAALGAANAAGGRPLLSQPAPRARRLHSRTRGSLASADPVPTLLLGDLPGPGAGDGVPASVGARRGACPVRGAWCRVSLVGPCPRGRLHADLARREAHPAHRSDMLRGAASFLRGAVLGPSIYI